MESIATAFEQIYHLTYNKVLYYILAKCGKVSEVEDILQETYAELYQVLTEKGSAYIAVPEGFVMQLAKSKVYRYYSEKERVQAKAFVETPEVVGGDINETVYHNRNEEWEDALIDKLTANEIMEYLAQKDELTREIFYQHYFQDKTLKEIAESSGMKEATVKKRLYRTLKELKGMKRFVVLIVVLLLAALLAKPVYTLAKNLVSQIRTHITDNQGRIMDDLVYYDFQGSMVELNEGDRIIIPQSCYKKYEKVAVFRLGTDFSEEINGTTEYSFVATSAGEYQVLAMDKKGNMFNITEDVEIVHKGIGNGGGVFLK